MSRSFSVLALGIAASLFLVSCGSSTSTDMNGKIDSYMQQKYGSGFRSGKWGYSGSGRVFGSGGSFSGSRDAFGSGRVKMDDRMSEIFAKMSEEDKALFAQMRDARRAGDMQKSDTLREQLQKKYPDLFPRMTTGSGVGAPSGSGASQTGSVSLSGTSSK